MFGRLLRYGLGVVSVALVAMVIPLALAARDVVLADEVRDIADRARVTADAWEAAQFAADDGEATSDVPVPPGRGDVTLILPDGTSVGPAVPAGAEALVASAAAGRPASGIVEETAVATAPAELGVGVGVVMITAPGDAWEEGLASRLAALATVSAALLLFAGVAAWSMARRTARPILEVADVAHRMADGDLAVRAEPSGITEVQNVATALNRLAARVGELLATERAESAELAHQLRTPLTVLSVDIDGVDDPDVRARLQEDVLALQRTTDEIIRHAGRAKREGLRARCDAAQVVAERVDFWRVLAEDQRRDQSVRIPPGPLWVRLSADDLATLVDVLLQNVFVHTPEGTPFEVALQPADARVVLRVGDAGPGFEAATVTAGPARTGSTGLGLSIAERLAVASGGSLARSTGSAGGAVVTVELGPPAE